MGLQVAYDRSIKQKRKLKKELKVMSFDYAVTSGLEIIAVILVFLGLFFEDKVNEWQDRFVAKIKSRIFRKKKCKITHLNRRPHNDKVG